MTGYLKGERAKEHDSGIKHDSMSVNWGKILRKAESSNRILQTESFMVVQFPYLLLNCYSLPLSLSLTHSFLYIL